MKSWIVVDLDGTLADCSHRVHLAEQKLWDEFHAGIPDDRPYEDVVYVLSALHNADSDLKLIVVTGRNEAYAEPTRRWLAKNVPFVSFEQMLFRPDDDRSPDHELKPRLLAEFFGTTQAAVNNVRFILEDRDAVTEALRNVGFFVWQVRPGAF
jgi:phosphoglycolate phosphatase-like HAD superfamily hydrolase